MSTQPVLVCSQFSQTADGVTNCTSQAWVDTYVLTPDEQAQLELVIHGGFDSSTFLQFFGATLTLFAIGFAAGIIISQLRKAKRG
ncbi:hypothetical protein [Pseudomonas sp. PS02290]|uniref:hypothetical protein n=1 Tax=Pseudomonas sp. PS02290 TaxID=2991430 RepID=UPI00249CA233|nr:hypothetical protein [Pseudomonas sp. PS02290]